MRPGPQASARARRCPALAAGASIEGGRFFWAEPPPKKEEPPKGGRGGGGKKKRGKGGKAAEGSDGAASPAGTTPPRTPPAANGVHQANGDAHTHTNGPENGDAKAVDSDVKVALPSMAEGEEKEEGGKSPAAGSPKSEEEQRQERAQFWLQDINLKVGGVWGRWGQAGGWAEARPLQAGHGHGAHAQRQVQTAAVCEAGV